MAERPWTSNGPEDRLSIAVDRFLRRALVPPFYCTAIHDRDGGDRSVLQRVRDANRGIHKGQLDWDVVQGPPYLHRKLELKRNKNTTTNAQDATIAALIACGGPPIVAWSLRMVCSGLMEAGFHFHPNVETVLQHLEAELAGWDREADLIRASVVVKKRSTRRVVAKPTMAKVRAVAAVRERVRF